MLKRIGAAALGVAAVAMFCLGGLDLVAGETRVFKTDPSPTPTRALKGNRILHITSECRSA